MSETMTLSDFFQQKLKKYATTHCNDIFMKHMMDIEELQMRMGLFYGVKLNITVEPLEQPKSNTWKMMETLSKSKK